MVTDDSERQTDVRYQPDENPPVALVFGLGLQLAILGVVVPVLIPAVVIRAAGGTEALLSWTVFAAVVTMVKDSRDSPSLSQRSQSAANDSGEPSASAR